MKNNSEQVRAKELFQIMTAYSGIRSANGINECCGLDNVLEYCAILYQPEHCRYYAMLDETGNVSEQTGMNIPGWLPQDYKELVEHCTGVCYRMMLGCLSGQEQYLAYPQLDEMEKHIEHLCMEECMQFFMYYNRLSLRHGQQYFFRKWQEGIALRIVERMQQLWKCS